MQRSIQALVGLLLAGMMLPAQAETRVWKDVTGLYTIEADLIGFDENTVILQRANKELGACPIDKLSEEDREYLNSKAAVEAHNSNLGTLQTWTLVNGVKVIGRIVDYTQRDVTVQRRRGKLYVNDTVYENLPPVYQRMLLAIVQYQEQFAVSNKADLDRWVYTLKGQPKTYQLDGVIIELENGDEYSVPFFLFAEQDQELLKGGFDEWLGDHKLPEQGDTAPDYTDPNEHQLRLQSLAAAYQQNQQVNQQIAIMNLNMQAIQAGLTSAWEVTLYPGPGNPYPPRWVVTMGRNSEIATQIALQQNPGFVPGPVRRVSN
jgi:hypothetical protein